MKTGKASGPSDVLLELNAASEGVEIQVIAGLCQRPTWISMPVEQVLSIMVPIFMGRRQN